MWGCGEDRHRYQLIAHSLLLKGVRPDRIDLVAFNTQNTNNFSAFWNSFRERDFNERIWMGVSLPKSIDHPINSLTDTNSNRRRHQPAPHTDLARERKHERK